MLFRIGVLLFFITKAGFSSGQTGTRYSENEISTMDKYLEAKVEIYRERYDLAIPLLLDLHREDRQNPVFAFDLAQSYEATEDLASAEKYASIAIRLDPENIWMQLYYAQLMIKMEKFYDAAEAFDLLSKIDPLDYSHIENYGKCLIRSGETKKAIEVLNNWEKENGIHEPAVRLKYEIYTSRKDKGNAEKELLKLVRYAPADIRYLHNLASFYMNNGDQDKARDVYLQILDIDPNDSIANTAMVGFSGEDKKDAPALRSLMSIISNEKLDPDVKVIELIPYVDQLTEKFDPATGTSLIEITRSLSLTHPDHAPSQAIYGDVLQLTGDIEGAIKAYEKTLELDDSNYMVWQQLMYTMMEGNRFMELSDVAWRAIDYFPNQPDAYFFYGVGENEKGNPAEALDILREGLLIAGNNISVKSNMLSEIGRSELINGDTAAAREAVEEALRLSAQKNPFALEVLGDLTALKGDHNRALELWKKSLELGSKRPSLLQKFNQ